eukprot:GHVN01039443.1.p1 GENE.GHVN01039443.1~~GHVN01039443.1.p1  ORF type:complete len:645 (-),score=198.85 GHVN01039443.1:9-1943(-)
MPCGGWGDVLSISQVAAGIPKWVGDRFFPDVFESPCNANTTPIVDRKKCNEQPCDDCAIWFEDAHPDRNTVAWVFFIPTQRSDELSLSAPVGFTFRPTGGVTGTEPSEKRKDDAAKSDNPNDIMLDDETHAPMCHVERTSFGEVGSCRALSVSSVGDLRRAHLKLKGVLETLTVKERRDLEEGKSSSRGRPQWVAIDVRIESVASMAQKVQVEVGPSAQTHSPNEWTLTLHGANSMREPETYSCVVKTPIMKAEDCQFVFEPQNPKQCNECDDEDLHELPAIRRFEPASNGGECSIPLHDRIDTLITLPCRHVCPVMKIKTVYGTGITLEGTDKLRKLDAESILVKSEGVALNGAKTGQEGGDVSPVSIPPILTSTTQPSTTPPTTSTTSPPTTSTTSPPTTSTTSPPTTSTTPPPTTSTTSPPTTSTTSPTTSTTSPPTTSTTLPPTTSTISPPTTSTTSPPTTSTTSPPTTSTTSPPTTSTTSPPTTSTTSPPTTSTTSPPTTSTTSPPTTSTTSPPTTSPNERQASEEEPPPADLKAEEVPVSEEEEEVGSVGPVGGLASSMTEGGEAEEEGETDEGERKSSENMNENSNEPTSSDELVSSNELISSNQQDSSDEIDYNIMETGLTDQSDEEDEDEEEEES